MRGAILFFPSLAFAFPINTDGLAQRDVLGLLDSLPTSSSSNKGLPNGEDATKEWTKALNELKKGAQEISKGAHGLLELTKGDGLSGVQGLSGIPGLTGSKPPIAA